VDDEDVAVPTRADTALGPTLEHEDDTVDVEVGDEQPLVEAAGRAGPVLPPPVGTRAHHVGAVDDEHPHARTSPRGLT
jgi:hypothetical protein